MQLAAPHFDKKSFVDGLMADFYHTAVIPYPNLLKKVCDSN
jgi:hypothetical protein